MPALWLAALWGKSHSRSYDGTKDSVSQNAVPAAARQTKTNPTRYIAKRLLPMSTPIASLLTVLVATAAKIARAALFAEMFVSFAIETVMASTSAKPATAALTITPIAPTRSPTKRVATTTKARNIAKAITDQNANGLRNVVGVAGFERRACSRSDKRPATLATKIATSRGGAIGHRSNGCRAATTTITRRNEMPLAIATPAARTPGTASSLAERRALATVTAVEETRPPAALDKRMPCRAPNTRTPTYPRKETPARAIAMSHI